MSNTTPAYEDNLLQRYDNWAVYLHENQTYLGRSYIALAREGEVDPFTDTTPAEQTEFLVVVSGLRTALSNLYQPDLVNYANLRNTWHHCHWHVIPRYSEGRTVQGQAFVDPNWGKNYAPYPQLYLPAGVHERIRNDMSTELAAI